MKHFKKILAVLMALSLFVLAGCGASKDSADKDQAKGDTLHIVTSFYPMYIDVANITKGVDGVEVTNMTKPQTGCLHDYQLTAEDMKTLEKADVFVANGAGMENFLEKAASSNKKLKIIEAADTPDIELIDEDGEPNPHVWTSISDNIAQVKNIAAHLEEIDPKHADAYRQNTEAYVQKLEALKKEMHAALDKLPHRDIVTFHEAFPYLAKEFNLNIIGVIEREPGTAPTLQELQETIEQVNALPVKVLFTEPQYSPDAAKTIADATGAKIYTLDPVVTGSPDDKDVLDAYLNTMHKNMETLEEALK